MPPELFNESYRAYDARVLFLFAQRPHYQPHDYLDRARVARDDDLIGGKGEGGRLALGSSNNREIKIARMLAKGIEGAGQQTIATLMNPKCPMPQLYVETSDVAASFLRQSSRVTRRN